MVPTIQIQASLAGLIIPIARGFTCLHLRRRHQIDAILKEMYKSEKPEKDWPTDDEERTVNLALPGDDDLIDLGATASSIKANETVNQNARKMNNGKRRNTF